jgi:hypothetical protein
MKKICFFIVCLFLAVGSMAQLKTTKAACPPFEVDILDGKVNNYKASATAVMVKTTWPCFTSVAGDSAKCGEVVYYKDKGITFYTSRKYVEIVEGFKGKMSVPLLGAARGSLFSKLGNPKMKDASWDAYQTNYGTLVLHYNNANKVRLIQFSTEGINTIKLCD